MERIQNTQKQLRKNLMSFWQLQVKQFKQQFDFIIVGAGFMGLWISYFLSKKFPEKQIAIFQRDFYSLGASTRNAGFITCGQISQIQQNLKVFDKQKVLKTIKMRYQGGLIIRNQIPNIQIQNIGSIDYDKLTQNKKKLIQQINNYFIKNNIKPIYQIKKIKLGNNLQQQYAFNSYDGIVHPVKLINSLRKKIFCKENVTLFKQQVIQCQKGILKTKNKQIFKYKKAYICINGFLNKLINTNIKPGRGQILVTNQIKQNKIKNKFMGYKNNGYDYWRWIGNRLLIGGGRHLNKKNQQTTDFQIRQSIIKNHLIQLIEIILGNNQFQIDYHWAGIMAFNQKQIFPIQQNIDQKTCYLNACNGMGVAFTPYFANKIVNK